MNKEREKNTASDKYDQLLGEYSALGSQIDHLEDKIEEKDREITQFYNDELFRLYRIRTGDQVKGLGDYLYSIETLSSSNFSRPNVFGRKLDESGARTNLVRNLRQHWSLSTSPAPAPAPSSPIKVGDMVTLPEYMVTPTPGGTIPVVRVKEVHKELIRLESSLNGQKVYCPNELIKL